MPRLSLAAAARLAPLPTALGDAEADFISVLGPVPADGDPRFPFVTPFGRIGLPWWIFAVVIGRERATRVAELVGSEELRRLAMSDVYWDRIEAIEPDGEAEVYDLSVDRLHNFVAGLRHEAHTHG